MEFWNLPDVSGHICKRGSLDLSCQYDNIPIDESDVLHGKGTEIINAFG